MAFPYRELCCEAEKCPTLCVVSGPQLGDGDTLMLRSAERQWISRCMDAQRREAQRREVAVAF